MKFTSLFVILGGLAFFNACSQSNEEQTATPENGFATLTLQVTGMT